MVDTEDVYGSNPMRNAAGRRDECLVVLPSAGADPVAASGRGSPLLPTILYGKGLNSQLCLQHLLEDYGLNQPDYGGIASSTFSTSTHGPCRKNSESRSSTGQVTSQPQHPTPASGTCTPPPPPPPPPPAVGQAHMLKSLG